MFRYRPACLGILLACGTAFGQRLAGEIHLQVKDAAGAALEAAGTLRSLATGVSRRFETDAQGAYVFRALPFGPYRITAEKAGFATSSILVEVRTETPLQQDVTLGVAPIETTVTVREADTLTDSRSPTATRYLGADALDHRAGSSPGHSVADLANTQPGWLLEANGVLHPRGSEYQVQYVIDGIPLYDNRSPAFAQSLGVDEFESMNIRTAGYPAEFGRKLGGVIEVATSHDAPPGWHGRFNVQGGSFAQMSSFSSVEYARGRNAFALSGEGMTTDRYLDPPVLENYTNHGSGAGFAVRFARNWSIHDSTRVYFNSRRFGFLVPNEQLQEAAGQRQDRNAGETLGQVSHTHLFSPHVLAQVRMMVRDTSARLWSNPFSTPIAPLQDRGFRETYVGGSVAVHQGRHEIKAGGEALFSAIREDFSYHIVTYRVNPGNVRVFDSDLPRDFLFHRRGDGRDQAAFVQDSWHAGNFTLNAGLRFDHYRLAQNESAWSPRLGAAYAFPRAGLVIRAAYDRVFQVPATENVLLASTDLAASLGGGAFLPLRPGRGNFVEAGFTKSWFGHLRIDGTWYRRRVDNFADDSLLLNTGVSFPIAFQQAEIHGYEAKIEVPAWGPFGVFVSYSNMNGTGTLPVAGGLFLGDNAGDLVNSRGTAPITQDQRNTLRSRFQFQPHRRVWFALGGAYNSGLPFEIDGPTNRAFIVAQYGPQIISKVNFDRGRVRPSATIDTSMGIELLPPEKTRLTLQADVFNLGDRLNLINFAGVLSGTALDAGRSFALRLKASF